MLPLFSYTDRKVAFDCYLSGKICSLRYCREDYRYFTEFVSFSRSKLAYATNLNKAECGSALGRNVDEVTSTEGSCWREGVHYSSSTQVAGSLIGAIVISRQCLLASGTFEACHGQAENDAVAGRFSCCC